MNILRVPLCVVTIWCGLLAPQAMAEPGICAVTERSLREAAKLRALEPRASVPCIVRSRTDIEAFLRQTIAEKFPEETLAMEELWYQALGIVPDDYPYEQEIVQAYVQQIGGYYDPDRKEFVMLDTMAEQLQEPVAVHELTHALQDQLFGLVDFLDPKARESDELMSRAALVEGDATAIMQDFMSSSTATSSKRWQKRGFSDTSLQVPEALERILLFPYFEGLSFVRYVQRHGGLAALNAAFSSPPKTSREIVHPEQFVDRSFLPQPLPVDQVESPRERTTRLYSDTVGEFAVSALLGVALSSKERGARCAQGWRRDRLAIFQEENRNRVVSWMSEWESNNESVEFYDCYRELLNIRYQRDVRDKFVAVSPRKRIKISRSGVRVSVVVELSAPKNERR
ncbi:MAG: hypothetical protein RL518_722 [Pseudomonadota bacterium]